MRSGKVKKLVIITILFFITGFFLLNAQQNRDIGAPDPDRIGIESGQNKLREISVEKFELDGFWKSGMSSDEGYTTTRLFGGSKDPKGPKDKEAIQEDEGLGIKDDYVLGTRVDFLRRGHNSFTIYPLRPIPIPGITKTISVWIAGRNFNHEVTVLLQDFFGKNYEIKMGKLNFMGWKKLEVAVPPQADDGVHGIIQRNYHYQNQMGIKITGFRIDCDPLESYGSYYIYFDDLRAWTDLFAEENPDEDDMVDGW
jgi:hypothetical protein